VEAQAATLDLVAKEAADAKRLLGELESANKKADEKVSLIERKTAEAMKLAEPATLTFEGAIKNTEVQQLCETVIFKASKNEPFGRLSFEVSVVEPSSAELVKLWPSLKGGAFQTADQSFQPSKDGKSAKLIYQPVGAETAAFDISVSEPAVVHIEGNRLAEPVNLRIE
jgi:hypothetical protein